MKKFLLLTIFIVTPQILNGYDIYSSLDDFKSGTERSGSKSGSVGGGSLPSSSSSTENSCLGDCMSMVLGSLFDLWFFHNLAVFYSYYPYDHIDFFKITAYSPVENNFINYCQVGKNSKGELIYNQTKFIEKFSGNDATRKKMETEEDAKSDNIYFKSYFYTIDAGGQHLGDEGKGGFAMIRGKFWKFFGPETEVKHINDGKDYLNYYAFGLNVSFIQASGFMPDFYIQSIHLRGILRLNGWAYGIIINSYPVKPVSLFFRIGQQKYMNDKYEVKFIDIEGRLGIVIDRFEIFSGYRRIKTEYAALKGPLAGIRLHF